MTTWEYSARTVGGEIQRDEIERPSRDDVVAYLRQRKLIPINIREKEEELSFELGTGVSNKDLVLFTRQFATMVNSGLPLVQALNILADQTQNDKLQQVVRDVLYDVESGHTLADALAEHPDIFSDLYVNMVEAGEAGGILDTILLRLSTFLEKNEALARKVKGAMIYPAVIMVVAVAAIAILLLFVIPTFQQMFASFDQQLPLPTRIVIGMSQFLQTQGLWVLIGLVGGGFLFNRWINTESGKLSWHKFLLRVPILGGLVRKASIARFTRTLGTLLSSGVSILEGLEITARTSGNKVVEDAVMQSRSSIAGGKSIAEPLAETEVFPPMVTQMINVGEQTGDLDGMLSKIADFYDDEVDVAVESLLKALEPAMIVVLGVIVGGMIVAMYLPIFGIINTVQ
jgi:type IV pilus assembly protein PilC